ncbi:MAG: hypothetical protein J6S67_22295 [Methanobrevibacter sp.]|nr:hypothetical protein [Methanobrevibacter sp.]
MYKYLIFFIIVVVLGFGVYYYREESKHYADMYNNAQANAEFLIKQRERDNEKTLAISERNRELEQAAKLDKSFDWHTHLPSGAILDRLHQDSN